MALGWETGALAWELHAAMSPVRLRERQVEAHAAKLAEARLCLRDVYARAVYERLGLPRLAGCRGVDRELGTIHFGKPFPSADRQLGVNAFFASDTLPHDNPAEPCNATLDIDIYTCL